MVTLSVYDISNWISDMTILQRQHMLSLVCVERQKKIAQIKKPERKDYVLVAGYLLEQQLREYIMEQYAEDVCELHFSYGKQGKPYLAEYPKVYFNMSHSGSYVAIAIGTVCRGVDVEVNGRNALAVAKRCFHEREYQELLCYKEEPKLLERHFKQYWSMKEAYIKYKGEGLQIPLSSFLVLPEEKRIAGQDKLAFYCDKLNDGCVSLCYEVEGNPKVNYNIQVCAKLL